MKIEFRKEYCDDFLCEYFRIHELVNIQDLIDEVKKLEIESNKFKYIITLDDIGQASYTSMHSKMSNELDGGDWFSTENIDSSWLDEGYPREDLNFDQRFTIRQMGFKHGLSNTKYEDIFNKNIYLDQESRTEIIDANQNLLSLMDKEAYLLKIPVEFNYEAIFSFPNGYFSCDLSPFENYHLAKHLEENYDYRLFGIGASYISFIKGSRFTLQTVDSLLELLKKLYIKDNDNKLVEFLKDTIINQEYLTLRYSE